jgi:hypothetical protein
MNAKVRGKARQRLALDSRPACQAAGQDCGRRSGGQDRPHHLGDAELGPRLQGLGLQGLGCSVSRDLDPHRVRRKRQHGKMVRTWVGTLRFVIALQKRAGMIGTRSA